MLALTVLPVAAQPQPSKGDAASSGPSPDARAANKRALELFKNRKYAEALDQFQRAYDLSPSWLILCNIGKMSRYTQDFARSLDSYQKCLRDAGPDVDAGQRSDVEHEIAELTSLVGWVTLSGEEGTTVSLDGKALGTLPLDHKVAVNPGPLTFSAAKGQRHREATITATAAQTVDVDLTLQSAGAIPKGPTPPQSFRFPDAAVVSAWVVSGLFAASAVATGTVALVSSTQLKSTVYVGPANAPPPDSPLAAKARRIGVLSTSTDVFIGIAVVAGVAGASFSIVNAVNHGPKNRAQSSSVHLGVTPGGGVAWGTFE
jgi:hypothetical protein